MVPFTTVGLLAGVLSPLAETGIDVFAVSTFDTDYVLAKDEDWAFTLDALGPPGVRDPQVYTREAAERGVH